MRLDENDQKNLDDINARRDLTCGECKQRLYKQYCGVCDEYYNSGHTQQCSDRLDRGTDHSQCRRPY